MDRKLCIRSCITAAIAAFATMMMALDANAFLLPPLPRQNSGVALIAGGCGPGFHRGPYGGCLPNVAGYPAYGGVYGGGAYYGGGVYRGGVYRGGGVSRGGCTAAVCTGAAVCIAAGSTGVAAFTAAAVSIAAEYSRTYHSRVALGL